MPHNLETNTYIERITRINSNFYVLKINLGIYSCNPFNIIPQNLRFLYFYCFGIWKL